MSSNNSSYNSQRGSSGKGSSSSANDNAPISDYKFIKDGWGDKHNFMASYGIKPTPDGYEEARVLLDGLRESSGAGVSPYRDVESSGKK
jgi:hypothetical protein